MADNIRTALVALRQTLISAITIIENLYGLPPISPTKDERRLLALIRRGNIDLRSVKQFVETQLT